VVREFLRARYRIVSTEDSADAVLRGELQASNRAPSYRHDPDAERPSSPTATRHARATTMLVSVPRVLLEESKQRRSSTKNDNYLFREATKFQ